MIWQSGSLSNIAYGYGDFEFVFHGGKSRFNELRPEVILQSILVLRGHCPELARALGPPKQLHPI